VLASDNRAFSDARTAPRPRRSGDPRPAPAAGRGAALRRRAHRRPATPAAAAPRPRQRRSSTQPAVWDKKALDLAMDRETGILEMSAKPAPGNTEDIRSIKASPDFVATRERILGLIWATAG
jgi:hypothetical protein